MLVTWRADQVILNSILQNKKVLQEFWYESLCAHFLPIFLLNQNNLYAVMLIKPCLLLQVGINYGV